MIKDLKMGSIVMVDFNLVPGSTIQKLRQAMVVSSKPHCKQSDRIVVIPITTSFVKRNDNDIIYKTHRGIPRRIAIDEIVNIHKCYVTQTVHRVPNATVRAVMSAYCKIRNIK